MERSAPIAATDTVASVADDPASATSCSSLPVVLPRTSVKVIAAPVELIVVVPSFK